MNRVVWWWFDVFFTTQWEACDSGLQNACFMPMTVFYGLVGDEEDSDWTPGTSEHHDELPADAEEGPEEVEPKELGAGSCGMFMYFSIF